MSKYSHIIFDLDGTLTDPRQGVGNSISYALDKMNINGFDGIVPHGFIGPPLQLAFKHFFKFDDRQILLVVEYFREYYSTKGLLENEPYPGIPGMLKGLHEAGKKLYVATAKLEKFALEICSHFGFTPYITQLKGADYHGEKSKQVLISELMKDNHISAGDAIVMVGDTIYDMEGGNSNHIANIAVGWGFGNKADLLDTGPVFYADDVEALYHYLLGQKG
jgi:phosphoglycolate phosphatase